MILVLVGYVTRRRENVTISRRHRLIISNHRQPLIRAAMSRESPEVHPMSPEIHVAIVQVAVITDSQLHCDPHPRLGLYTYVLDSYVSFYKVYTII